MVMHSILIGLVIGLVATFSMDFVAIQLMRRKVFDLHGLQVVPSLLGRWAFHFLRHREIFVEDIRSLPSHESEVRAGFMLHYLIGAILGILFSLSMISVSPHGPAARFIFGLGFGVLTNVFPWALMYPSMGLGFLANKLSFQSEILKLSFLNHAVYGAALGALFAFLY